MVTKQSPVVYCMQMVGRGVDVRVSEMSFPEEGPFELRSENRLFQ